MSSTSPIPQMVNISHALQSNMIEKIRSDIKDLQQVQELSLEQQRTVNRYIESLKLAFTQFTKDNEHVEHGDSQSITAADTQLYMGLKGMYADYLSQLERIKQEKATNYPANDTNESIMKYIKEQLPEKHAKERRLYIEGLIKDYSNSKLPSKSPQFVQSILKLCSLDSDFSPSLKSYIRLLRKVGYKYDTIKEYVPQDLAHLISEFFSDTPAGKGEDSEYAIGDESLNKSIVDDEPKKKISFLRYLKKGDGTMDQNSKQNDSTDRDDSIQPTKKIKRSGGDHATLNSILKTSGSGRKVTNSIRFRDDAQLVKVYGEELPTDGLIVSPEELKKILKPFKEGEPREVLLLENYEGKAKELDIEFDVSPEESDVTEIKGGPIPCETVVPLKYRINFSNFTSDLSSKPAREPVVVDELVENNKNSKGPLIMKPFGKNSLLLRKDRGGIPYRRVQPRKRRDKQSLSGLSV